MAEFRNFNALDLTTIPFNEHDCIFENRFILAGDLDDSAPMRDLTRDPTMRPFLTSPYPFQIRFAMMHLCLGGRMRIRSNLNEYELHRNSLTIITPGTIGQCLEISPDCRIAIIAFATVNNLPEGNPQSALIMRKFLIDNAMLQLSDREMGEMIGFYHQIRQQLVQPERLFTHEIINSYIQIFYYSLCQLMSPYIEQQDTQYVSRKKQIFDQFTLLLRQHYTQERSIGFYADQLCLTPKYLSQVVRNFSGRHAGEWIRDYVILEAKALLKSGQYNVQQVSDMLNFANQSFFGAYFKKAVGCSPSAYQNS